MLSLESVKYTVDALVIVSGVAKCPNQTNTLSAFLNLMIRSADTDGSSVFFW